MRRPPTNCISRYDTNRRGYWIGIPARSRSALECQKLYGSDDNDGGMCFSISLIKEREYIEDRFGARFVGRGDFTPVYHVSAFSLPRWPVITMGGRGSIVEAVWGSYPPGPRMMKQPRGSGG